MIYVVAGNEREFTCFLKEKGFNRKDCLYVYTVTKLLGRRIKKGESVIYYGTWWNRPDIAEIRKRIEIIKER